MTEEQRTIDFTAEEISMRHHLNRANRTIDNMVKVLEMLRKDVRQMDKVFNFMHDTRMDSGVPISGVDPHKSCQCYECVAGYTGTVSPEWSPVGREEEASSSHDTSNNIRENLLRNADLKTLEDYLNAEYHTLSDK